MEYTIAQLAYLAGLLDGEGCFHICDKVIKPRKSRGIRKTKKVWNARTNFSLMITICNTNLEVLNWLKDVFGGFVYIAKKPGKPGWDIKKAWHMPCGPSRQILEAVLPYLIIKKNQAKLMIEGRKIIDANPKRIKLPEESYQHLFFLATNMKLFNKKNPSALLSPPTQQGDPSQLPQVYPRQVC